MRKHFPLSIACIVVCAGLLAACDKGPDTEKTKLELVMKTESEGDTAEETTNQRPEVSKEETTKSTEQTESEYDPWKTKMKMIAERVLVAFANECLEQYYTDNCLLEYETGTDAKDAEGNALVPEPGSTLYYRIEAYEYEGDYRVVYSSEESFARSGSLEFHYNEYDDAISQIRVMRHSAETLTSGKLILPERFVETETAKKQRVLEAIREFWKNWQSEDYVINDWPMNVKHAYLMPFSIEEKKHTEFTIFLEQENDTWLMLRGLAAVTNEKDSDPNAELEILVDWENSLFETPHLTIGGESDAIQYLYYNDLLYDLNVQRPQFHRFYCPEPTGFKVYNIETYDFYEHSYEENGQPPIGCVSDGSFVGRIPELALEELPLTDSLTQIPTSLVGEDSTASDGYVEIVDRILTQEKNRCLYSYYLGETVINDDSTWLKPGTTIDYEISIHKPSMSFLIRCYEHDNESTISPDLAVGGSRYIYHMRGDWLYYYPDFTFDAGESLFSGSFDVPNSYENQPKPDSAEYQKTDQSIHRLWEKWLEGESPEDGLSPVRNAYLMPYYVDDMGFFYVIIHCEREDGSWNSLITSGYAYSPKEYAVEKEELYTYAFPLNETVKSAIPELALEKLK